VVARFFTTVADALWETRRVSSGLSPVIRSTRGSPRFTSSIASAWLSVWSNTMRCTRGIRLRSQYPGFASSTTRSDRFPGMETPSTSL
jgi:hypothetical protein